ncbi:MAG: CidA/LrgA family protein [Mucinivorans sp.]
MVKIFQILTQIFWILFFYALGTGVSFLIGGIIPGSVIGMMSLFVALSLGWLKPEKVQKVAQWLIRYMVLFFLPPAIGIIAAWDRVSGDILAIGVAMVVSTTLVIVSVAWTQEFFEKHRK